MISPLHKTWAHELISQDPRIRPGEARTFHVLLGFANSKTGACFPSQAKVAQRTGFTIRTTRSHIRRLEVCGYLVSHRNKGPNGVCLYQVYVPTGKEEFRERKREVSQLRKPTSDKPTKETNSKLSDLAEAGRPSLKPIDPDEMSDLHRKAGWVEAEFKKATEGDLDGYLRAFSNGMPEIIESVESGALPPKVALQQLKTLAAGG